MIFGDECLAYMCVSEIQIIACFVSRSMLLSWASLLLWILPTITQSLQHIELTRRDAFEAAWAGLLSSGGAWISSADEDDAGSLPSTLKSFTRLAPLGPNGIKDGDKLSHLSLMDLKERLEHDLTRGYRGTGSYIVTGDLCPQLFRDDCIFSDPTTEVKSLSQYRRALEILFEPNQSTVALLGPLQVDDSARTLTGRFRSRGYLRLPWHPYVKAYESTIVYSVDGSGLIARQDQTWTKSATTALQETFTPSLVDPPAKCDLPRSDDEPILITKLFNIVNGRRPTEYSREERVEADDLLQSIAATQFDWDPSMLPGKWILAYVRPGPDGATIDRRIPFPDAPFNDNFQTFGPTTVQNTGELIGPLVSVQVFGDLDDVDNKQKYTPKRYQANIRNGKVCFRTKCPITLPISGNGLFDGVYLGKRLRIGQNINGGGAMVVQVRVE